MGEYPTRRGAWQSARIGNESYNLVRAHGPRGSRGRETRQHTMGVISVRSFTGRLRLVATLLVVVHVSVASHASEPARHGRAIKAFRRFAEERIRQDAAPGLSIGFMYNNFTWAEGFGYADLENEVSAKDVSAYRLASVTKPMTAIGILHLVEEGMLDLDAEVQTYVPYFPRKPWPVRVRQLLGHLGGISHYRNYDLEGHFKEHKDTREAIAVFEDFDLVAEPGTQYNYSSYGYNLLGAVIEGAAGEPYGEFMQRVLWEPLGMEDTRMDDPYVIIPNRVRGYRPGPNGEIIPSEFVDISSRFAAGGTRSTVVDLLRLAAGLRDGRVLSQETLDLMWTPMQTRDGRGTGYAMGWRVRPMNGRFAVGHTGAQAETRTYFMYIPSQQLAIAAAVNYEGGGWLPYVQRLYQLLMDEGFNQAVYATSDDEQRIYDALAAVFDSGLPHYERYRRPFTTDAAAVARAFAYLDDVLDGTARGDNPDSIAAKIADGRHPVSGSAFAIVGSHMAHVLVQAGNESVLDAIHKGGAIELFAAYVDAYRKGHDVPTALRFSSDLERVLLALREDWRRTWTNDSRRLAWPTYGGIESFEPLLEELERRFTNTSIYPDFAAELSAIVTQRVVAEDAAGAVRAADWARAHYTRRASAHIDAAIAYLVSGDGAQARHCAAQALALAPETVASARGLNRRAYALRAAGALQAGLDLLALARELHPEDANLCDSTGEFHRAAGRREEAIAWYEKALELDPEFENASRMLQELRAEMASVSGR